MSRQSIIIALTFTLISSIGAPVLGADNPLHVDVCKNAGANDDVREAFVTKLLERNPVPITGSMLKGDAPNSFADAILKCRGKCDNQRNIVSALNQVLSGAGSPYDLQWRNPFEKFKKVSESGRVDATLDAELEKHYRLLLDLTTPYHTMTCKNAYDDGGELIPPDRRTQVVASSRSEDDDEKKKCKPTDGGFCLSRANVAVMKDAASIGKAKNKRDPAKLAYSIDKVDQVEVTQDDGSTIKRNKEIVSANIALVYADLFNAKYGAPLTPRISPFVELDYKSNIDPKKETDNLAFGVSVDGDLPDSFELSGLPDNIGIGLDRYHITASWITDIEERESSQFFSTLNLPLLEFGAVSPPDWGRLNLHWYVSSDIAFDHSEIGEAGDKVALEKLSSFVRYGYDLALVARLGYGLTEWSTTLKAEYKFRDDFTAGPANADYWEVGLTLKPREDSNFSYGITYKRGENLKTLEDIENWEFSLGFKM